MKSKNLVLMSATALACLMSSTLSYSYPLIDQIVPVGGEPIKVYPDHQTPGVYWYIPQSIEPWKRNNLYRSAYYQSATDLIFVFRGQASVDDEMLIRVAKALGTSMDNLTPVAYDYSKDFQCQNVYGDDPGLKWIFPKMIGNYMEIVPVSIRATSPNLIAGLSVLLNSEQGLACQVEVGFKGVSTAYKLAFHAHLSQVYSRFEAAAHGEFLWFESDIHTLIESLIREKAIEIVLL
jgi:hypothetical protein